MLGLQKGASEDEIKKSFQKKQREFHRIYTRTTLPAKKNSKKSMRAYEVLSNADKRARYDQFGHEGMDAGFGAEGFSGGFTDMGDIPENIFGGFGFGGGFGGGSRSTASAPKKVRI